MSYKQNIVKVKNTDIPMYTKVNVAQNEPMLNQTMNRSICELSFNDDQLSELKKIIFAELNISEYIFGNAYNVGDLVWYKDSNNVTYLLRCIQQGNSNVPDVSGISQQYFSKKGDELLIKSGWENQNKNLSILDYDIMNLVNENAQALIEQHENDKQMHPFGNLSSLNDRMLKSDLSNIEKSRKHTFFPYNVKRLQSGIAIITGYQRLFDNNIVEYDIVLKLASNQIMSHTAVFENIYSLSANNTKFQLFQGVSQTNVSFQLNNNYFSSESDMDIFGIENAGSSRCGIILQKNRNDYVNTYTAKVNFPIPFTDLNYMVFSNSILSQTIGSSTMVPSANDITYCDKTRQSITFIDITFPDSTKYGQPGYNSSTGGLVANSFHMKVIGHIGA